MGVFLKGGNTPKFCLRGKLVAKTKNSTIYWDFYNFFGGKLNFLAKGYGVFLKGWQHQSFFLHFGNRCWLL